MASPIETAPGLLPAVQFGQLVAEFIHEVAPGPCRFGPSEVQPGPCTPPGQVFSAFVHALQSPPEAGLPGIDVPHSDFLLL